MSFGAKILYGLQVAAIGLVVVFLGLAILIGFISLMAQVFKAIDARKAEKAKAEAERLAKEQEAAEKARLDRLANPTVEDLLKQILGRMPG